MTHELKTWLGSFEHLVTGDKKHEVRKCDRPFKVGDTVIFREFIPEVNQHGPVHGDDGKIKGTYTNRNLARRITYISQPGSFGLPQDVCVFSIDTL